MFGIISLICHWLFKIGNDDDGRRQRRRQRIILNQQKSIKDFCADILNGKNVLLEQQILRYYSSTYDTFFVDHDVMTFPALENHFRLVCANVFSHRPATGAYIIVILGYALKLHRYHMEHSKSWYNIELDTTICITLADILKQQGFSCFYDLQKIIHVYVKCIYF